MGPDGEEGEESGTPPQPPPSPETVTSGEVSGESVFADLLSRVSSSDGWYVSIAMTAPPANSHNQKKRNPRFKKPSKMGSPEAATPLPEDEGSDSGEEYHDALPGQWEWGAVMRERVGGAVKREEGV